MRGLTARIGVPLFEPGGPRLRFLRVLPVGNGLRRGAFEGVGVSWDSFGERATGVDDTVGGDTFGEPRGGATTGMEKVGEELADVVPPQSLSPLSSVRSRGAALPAILGASSRTTSDFDEVLTGEWFDDRGLSQVSTRVLADVSQLEDKSCFLFGLAVELFE